MTVTVLYTGNKLSNYGLTPGIIETLGPHLEEAGIKVYYAGTWHNKSFRFTEMIFKVLKYRKKADYVLIDTYSTTAFWFAFYIGLICKWLKIKYIPILHGGNLPDRLNRSPGSSNILFKNSYINVAVSGYLEHEFKIAGYNTILIPNNIDIQKYLFKNRFVPQPKLLWVRSFHRQYNPLMAIDVLKRLLELYPAAELCMVGPDKDGSLAEFRKYAAKVGIEKSIEIKGLLTRQEWIMLSKDYDFFINTTNVDNTPVSVIEAMALGLCVISTNPGGIKYLLEDNKNALLCKPGDSERMASFVQELLADNQKFMTLCANGRLVAESFSWDAVKEKWLDLLS